MTIASMHSIGGNGGANATRKTRALAITFAVSISFRVLASYFPGLLWDWHFFTWFHVWSGYNSAALAVENWGWFIEFTPAFIGSGMLVGLNPAISFFGGSVLAWGKSLLCPVKQAKPLLILKKVLLGPLSSTPVWLRVFLGSKLVTQSTRNGETSSASTLSASRTPSTTLRPAIGFCGPVFLS